MRRLSIIIPMLDESAAITSCLERLQALRQTNHELIVVDGGSSDDGLTRAESLCDVAMTSPAGRAAQMNAGAQAASGDYFLFVHADTALDANAQQTLLTALQERPVDWGFFQVKLDGERLAYRVIETMMNWRSRATAVATGDQCLFISRGLFAATGGFPNIALMEDVALCKRLRRHGRPLVIDAPVVTSARRWQRDGVCRTVMTMWLLRAAYFCGASPRRLHAFYYGSAKG